MRYNGENLMEVLCLHKQYWMYDRRTEYYRADFSGALLRGANLRGVMLRDAIMHGTDLTGADLSGSDLSRADLRRANLYGANLQYTNLYHADLTDSNLKNADLLGADLREANLYEADMRFAENVPYVPMACPDTGAFIAWKKCELHSYAEYFSTEIGDENKVIVKLLIPEDAKRSSATGKKCRADKAIVLGIETLDGKPSGSNSALSNYNDHFIYTVGKTVTPVEPFCEDRFCECASGIHFFINRQDAVNY